jgi:TusA-related sulfurtransferase
MIEATAHEKTATRTLDNRGSDCASGFARLLAIIDEMAPGELLRVLSSDGAAPRELRDWARRSGNTLLETTVTGPFWRREYELLIRKE